MTDDASDICAVAGEGAPPEQPPSEKEVAAGDVFVEDDYKKGMY